MGNNYERWRIGLRIKSAREHAQLSQAALGEKIGYGYQMIGKWERGETIPSLDKLLSLCEVFECELGYLLGEHDCYTREATDIQEKTGLSEKAIRILSDFNQRQKESEAVTKLMKTINILIEHEDEQLGRAVPLETISAMIFTRFGCGKYLFVDESGEMQLAQSREEFSAGTGEVLFASEADFAVMEKMGDQLLRYVRELRLEMHQSEATKWLDVIQQYVGEGEKDGQHS